MIRYADLSRELNEILKEIWKSLLEGFCYLTFSWYFVRVDGGWGCQNILSHVNDSVLTWKKLIHCVRSTKKRIYLIIVLIYNLDGGNKWDINTYGYITNDKWFFLHRRKHFLIIFNGNFLYFYFCKGWDACRFFYITKGTLIFAFAWHLGGAWAWHSISVYISFAKDACNMKSDFWKTIEAKVHQYLTIATKIPSDLPRKVFIFFRLFSINC